MTTLLNYSTSCTKDTHTHTHRSVILLEQSELERAGARAPLQVPVGSSAGRCTQPWLEPGKQKKENVFRQTRVYVFVQLNIYSVY